MAEDRDGSNVTAPDKADYSEESGSEEKQRGRFGDVGDQAPVFGVVHDVVVVVLGEDRDVSSVGCGDYRGEANIEDVDFC